jgi:mRNA interferase MazF
VKRGEIYKFALDPTVRSEQQKTRMCVVVRRNAPDEAAEQRNPMTIVVPLTDANGKVGNMLNVPVSQGTGGTTKDSLVLISQVRSIDKRRLASDKLGDLPTEIMQRVDDGLGIVLALI